MVSVVVALRLTRGSRVVGRQFGDFGQHLEADAAFRQHHRREVQADAEFLELDLVWQLTGRRAGSQVKPAGPEIRRRRGSSRISPEIAVRFGSASVRMTPARSIARNVALTPR